MIHLVVELLLYVAVIIHLFSNNAWDWSYLLPTIVTRLFLCNTLSLSGVQQKDRQNLISTSPFNCCLKDRHNAKVIRDIPYIHMLISDYRNGLTIFSPLPHVKTEVQRYSSPKTFYLTSEWSTPPLHFEIWFSFPVFLAHKHMHWRGVGANPRPLTFFGKIPDIGTFAIYS